MNTQEKNNIVFSGIDDLSRAGNELVTIKNNSSDATTVSRKKKIGKIIATLFLKFQTRKQGHFYIKLVS